MLAPTHHPRAFSVATLAERWGCSGTKVRALILSGELASFRLGKLYRIQAQALADYEGISLEALEQSRTGAPAPVAVDPDTCGPTVPGTLDCVLLSMGKAGLAIDRVVVAADGGFAVYVAAAPVAAEGARMLGVRPGPSGVKMTRAAIVALGNKYGK